MWGGIGEAPRVKEGANEGGVLRESEGRCP